MEKLACKWCGSRNIRVVEDGLYLHHICLRLGCHHEWDRANPNATWLEDLVRKDGQLDNPVRRRLDYGEFEECLAQAPDAPLPTDSGAAGSPSGVMRRQPGDRGWSGDDEEE
jgi:hypothetical protein